MDLHPHMADLVEVDLAEEAQAEDSVVVVVEVGKSTT
jgi:hypothetical protein